MVLLNFHQKNIKKKILAKSYFTNKIRNDLLIYAITPNRADCLGVRGIARDLSSAGVGIVNSNLKEIKLDKTDKAKHLY